MPIMALRLGPPEQLLDIADLPALNNIDVGDDRSVTIGALVKHYRVERSADVARYAPLLHQAMPHVGHRAIRTRGTICGSLAHGDPAAEIPAVALATGATLITQSTNGSREIDAADFFLGYLDTALEPDELLTAVRFPPWPSIAGASLNEISRRHGDYAMVGLACALAVDAGVIRDVALSFFGAASTPIRAADAEESLVGKPPTAEHIEAAASLVSSELSPSSDGHASAAYRRHIAGVLTRRGLIDALSTIGATS